MRFICDEMFGSLARWLRIMGHDVLYLRDVDDDAIIDAAHRQDRFILTRDKDLNRRYPRSLYINENDLEKQLRAVMDSLNLESHPENSRCTVCNGKLSKVHSAEVQDMVPPFTLQNQDEFFLCQECGKVFWKGSHWQQIESFLDAVMK
ncbi:MAG: Mut7-C RNAse domain-containing protein [Candidatus Methanomethylophilaceae archaeon]|nr:Mut7-C RNAse domain-containing protein [Candidatus Methanomethylophilaceae archaeon]